MTETFFTRAAAKGLDFAVGFPERGNSRKARSGLLPRTALPRNAALYAVLKSPLSFYGIYSGSAACRVSITREKEKERDRETERGGERGGESLRYLAEGKREEARGSRSGKHCMPNQTTTVDSALCVRSICRFSFNNVICMQGYIIFSRLLPAFRFHSVEGFRTFCVVSFPVT